jgi:hypothetical protein
MHTKGNIKSAGSKNSPRYDGSVFRGAPEKETLPVTRCLEKEVSSRSRDYQVQMTGQELVPASKLKVKNRRELLSSSDRERHCHSLNFESWEGIGFQTVLLSTFRLHHSHGSFLQSGSSDSGHSSYRFQIYCKSWMPKLWYILRSSGLTGLKAVVAVVSG